MSEAWVDFYMTFDELVEACRKYYQKPGNCAGGCLHIFLDDGNIGQKDVEFCRDYAREHNDADGLFIAEQILGLSKRGRWKLYDLSRKSRWGLS